jgi:UDP-N-acetylglucosamine:LPS N-acetylglucosamine transferase
MLIVCGSGGHAAEALIVYRDIKEAFDCSFLLESSDPLTPQKLKDVPVYKAVAVRGKREPAIMMIPRLMWCTIQSLGVLLRAKPDIILSTGPGLAGPISIWGKLFGKKIIFIESWCRVTTRSWPGRLLYPIADRFYIQWPEEKQNYPKATYAGRLG